MKAIAVIPARMGSSRFPGKPLAELLGRPMIEHVFKRVALSRGLTETYIATCDEEIREAAEGFGAPVLMTSADHERASDRVAEGVQGLDADVVVMVQGDEPMVRPEMIDAALAPFRNGTDCECVNLAYPITDPDDWRNPNTIKVVIDNMDNALYMSRQAIPTATDDGSPPGPALKQVCIIPFRYDILRRYTTLEPTPLEIAESIDMLRLMEHGYKVRMVTTEVMTQAVDTREDLRIVAELMTADPLCRQY